MRLRRQFDRHRAARRTSRGRPRPVGGERDLLGRPGEAVQPVRELTVQRPVLIAEFTECPPLPGRVVRVTDLQDGPVGSRARRPRPVRRGEIAGERTQREHVRGDVVQEQQEYVLVGGQGIEPDPQRRFGGQVEATMDLGA
ncbi:hypothetical protein GCM10010527_53010 [Streptomyces drozdowiczii]